MAATYDWSRFKLRIDIKASKSSLYEAWSTQEMLELWFLSLAEITDESNRQRDRFETVVLGDKYRWSWFGYGEDVMESGTILAANGEDYFSFSFGKAGNCIVRILEEEGENIVELVQEQIPTDEKSQHEFHMGCKMGWTFYLSNLKSILEGGVDLRNKNEYLKSMLNA